MSNMHDISRKNILDNAIVRDGIKFDLLNRRIHDWLVTENKDGSGKLMFIQLSERKNAKGLREIEGNPSLKCLDMRETIKLLDIEYTLENVNAVAYALDERDQEKNNVK